MCGREGLAIWGNLATTTKKKGSCRRCWQVRHWGGAVLVLAEGAEAVLGDLDVLTVVCDYFHTLIVKKDGALCTFGREEHVALGHKAVANAHQGAAL